MDTDKAAMQLPEGKVIAMAMQRAGRSANDVAEHVGLSDARVRHIINGYQPLGRGQVMEVVAPAGTLARIAMEVGVTPDQMRDAGRADAADVMRSMFPTHYQGDPEPPGLSDLAKLLALMPEHVAEELTTTFLRIAMTTLQTTQPYTFRKLGRDRELAVVQEFIQYLGDQPSDQRVRDALQRFYSRPSSDNEDLSDPDDEISAAAKEGVIEEPGEFNT